MQRRQNVNGRDVKKWHGTCEKIPMVPLKVPLRGRTRDQLLFGRLDETGLYLLI